MNIIKKSYMDFSDIYTYPCIINVKIDYCSYT